VVRDAFPPVWLREQCSLFWQRTAAASQRAWRTAVPASSSGLQVVKDTGEKTFERLRAMPWRTMARRYKVPLLVLGGVFLAVMIVIKVPRWQAARWEGRIEAKEVAKQESDTRTTVVQAIGGAVLFIGLYFTAKTLHTTQEGQITDRFTKAINQLGEVGPEKLAIRLGGIYALERIARDSERDHWPVMEILTAYVREHARIREKPPGTAPESPLKLAPDVQAILTVIGRRARTYGKGEDHPLNLTYTDLRGAQFVEAHLEGALLSHTHLERANLVAAH
jgi:hypothetical protein